MEIVWFIVLLAWQPNGMATPDSGVSAHRTLLQCHNKSLSFSLRNGTTIQLCKKILEDKYLLIAKNEVIFNWNEAELPVVTPDIDPEVLRLRKALKAIGKWHRGKTKDSQRVRAIATALGAAKNLDLLNVEQRGNRANAAEIDVVN